MQELDLRLLSAITQHTSIALDFSLRHDPKLFIDQQSRVIAKPIIDYVKAYKTRPTKRALLEKYSSDSDTCQVIENFWDNIENIKYDEADYPFDLDQLKKRYGKALYDELKNRLHTNTDNPLSEIKNVESVINEIKSLNKTATYTQKSLKDHLSDFNKSYQAKLKDPELGKGILTGFSYLDYIKNGLRPSDLVVIAAETGGGKSLMLNNMAINIWKQTNTIDTDKDNYKKGYNVAYFSLEMPFEDCFQRTIAALADVPSYHIRDAQLTRAEAVAVKKSCEFINKYPYRFDIIDIPRGLTAEGLELHFERIKSQYKPDVVFIDYLGLMEEHSGDGDDWLKLGILAGKIHEFGRVYDIPVVTAVQLNRLPIGDIKKKEEHDAKKIGLHRIGRSSLIATHATLIIQIENRINEGHLRDFKYHILKNRHGESGGFHSITKNFAHCIIKDSPYDVELQESYTENYDISEDVSDIFAELDSL